MTVACGGADDGHRGAAGGAGGAVGGGAGSGGATGETGAPDGGDRGGGGWSGANARPAMERCKVPVTGASGATFAKSCADVPELTLASCAAPHSAVIEKNATIVLTLELGRLDCGLCTSESPWSPMPSSASLWFASDKHCVYHGTPICYGHDSLYLMWADGQVNQAWRASLSSYLSVVPKSWSAGGLDDSAACGDAYCLGAFPDDTDVTVVFSLKTPVGDQTCAELEVIFSYSSPTRALTVKSVTTKPVSG